MIAPMNRTVTSRDLARIDAAVPIAHDLTDVRNATDMELVALLREGNHRALTEIDRRYHDVARRSARAGIGSMSELGELMAEEAAVNVLTTVYGRLLDPTCAVPDSFDAYIARAARLEAKRMRRGDADRVDIGDAEVLGLLPSAVGSAVLIEDASNTDDDAVSPRVRALDGILSAGDLELLAWRADGVATTVIAEWLGVARADVSDRLHAARMIVARLVQVSGGAVRPPLTAADSRDLVSAFVTAQPSTMRIAVATALRDFATANRQSSVPTVIHRFMTRGAAQASRMLSAYATALRASSTPLKEAHARRQVMMNLCAFARANGYAEVPLVRVPLMSISAD